MGRIAIAVKHLLTCGASIEAVVAAIEDMEVEDGFALVKEVVRAHERERKRTYRENVPDSPGQSRTKEKPPHPQKKTTPVSPTEKLTLTVDLETNFLEFWAKYPRKVGKGAARKAYTNALKRVTPAEVLAGAERYAANRLDPQYTKHPATWLNAECWCDETEKQSLKTVDGGKPGLQFRPEPAKISNDEWRRDRCRQNVNTG